MAALYLPQILVPLSLVAILFVGGAGGMPGKMVAFLCGAAAYSLLAWKFPAVHQLILALVSLTVAATFAVLWMDGSGGWLAARMW